MKKVFKFVKGRRDDRGITPSSSGELLSPAQTPEDEKFLGLDNTSGYIVDFCGKDKTLTKLHKAAWQGNLDKIKNALKKVDIDVVDRHNRTPLHFAVAQGHPNIVWFLLGNNARHTICDSEGCTPLLKAVECCHKECMSLLMERGANVNHADFTGMTPIHIAVKNGAIEVATLLLEKGADPGVANNSGEYPLHVAIRAQNKDMVHLLLRHAAPVNAVDRENRTPLMLAAKNGNLVLAQLFFEYGAQLFVKDSNGWTAEDYALLGGHQNVATELKAVMKKESKPVLESHPEEDETVKSDVDTWNDSNPSEKPEENKVGEFLRKLSRESDKDEMESPGAGVVPPPCQPPRSWEIIEAGMIDEATDGGEPKRISLTALGSLHSRRESFTEHYTDSTKYTLSLNRRRTSSKKDPKQRFSFNEEESLKSSISDEFSILGSEVQQMMRTKRREKKELANQPNANDSGSEWDSNLSSLLENSAKESKPAEDGTLDRPDTLNEVGEMWVGNDKFPDPPKFLPEKLDEEEDGSWDSESFHESGFPPPPTAFELGVDMAKSMSYMKGISIDHAPPCAERENWRKPYEQSQSLDCLDENDESVSSGGQHSSKPSIAGQKWKSAELPGQKQPARLVEANKRISDQLECYDQALRELAESSYAKKQDGIVVKTPTQVDNYYSLPSSKIKADREFSLTGKTKASPREYAMSLPLNFKRQHQKPGESSDGPSSLPFSINKPPKSDENNEELGFEDEIKPVKPKTLDLSKVDGETKPKILDLGLAKTPEVENLESPMSDDLTGSDKSDQKSKRHMLLAMRDVKHAVQVIDSFKTSLDEHILSPLTKVDGQFDLSPNKVNAESVSPGEDQLYFLGKSQGEFERQETVIERAEYKKKSEHKDTDYQLLEESDGEMLIGPKNAKSSPSDSGDEPTLWLQDKNDDRRKSASSPDSPLSNGVKGHRTPSAALRRLQRLGSSSDIEDSVRERTPKAADADDGSPDVSLSSGPIEPLNKDSGSDADSSIRDATPVRHYSLKKHHKWLKDRLLTENKEKQKLEEAAAQLSEKAERLQYELEDAKEATKSRDEIITLLQGQLNRMEAAYTKSLEESVHCRLQLTTLEQEIFHLKELCSQYEEEREGKGPNYSNESQSVLLMTKIRQLEEERENLCREVVRLEQQKLCKGEGGGREMDDSQAWTERCETSEGSYPCQLVQNGSTPSSNASSLQRRNNELESQIILANDINRRLEDKLDKLITSNQLPINLEMNQSLQTLSRKNADMEKQLKNLVQQLNEKNTCRTKDDQVLIDRLNDEKVLLVKTYEKRLSEANSEVVESFKKENERLTHTISQLQDEIHRLIEKPNATEAVEEVENKEVLDDALELKGSTERKRSAIKSAGVQMKAKAVRDDELAWGDLYGMVDTRKAKTSPVDKDSEEFIEFKVKELEKELQKAKGEIMRQRTDYRVNALMPVSTELVDLKRKIVELEHKSLNDDALRVSLQTKTAEMAVGLQERHELEYELDHLKMRMQREFVPKVDAEIAKFQADLLSRKVSESSSSARLVEDGLRERLEVLAKEREKAEALRRRLGRQCVSWEAGFGPPPLPVPFRSLPRGKLLDKPPLPKPGGSFPRGK